MLYYRWSASSLYWTCQLFYQLYFTMINIMAFTCRLKWFHEASSTKQANKFILTQPAKEREGKAYSTWHLPETVKWSQVTYSLSKLWPTFDFVFLNTPSLFLSKVRSFKEADAMLSESWYRRPSTHEWWSETCRRWPHKLDGFKLQARVFDS